MQPGVDSYSYHRFFGEIRGGESDPGIRWSQFDLIEEMVRIDAGLVSLETCFFPEGDAVWAEMAAELDRCGLERAVAWGAPRGLKRGTDPDAAEDLMKTLELTTVLGASELRIVLGGPADFGAEAEGEALDRLAPILGRVLDAAHQMGVAVSAETHCDLTISALSELVDWLGGRLGVVLDTANVVRIGADLLEATRRLAPHVRMLHLKDIRLAEADVGDPAGWWPCVPLGSGDLQVAEALSILSGAGFAGPACVEVADVPAGADEREIVRQGLERLQTER